MSNFTSGFSSKYIIGFFAFFVLTFSSLGAFSEEHRAEEEKFDAGRMIFEHVLDAHDWHIATINGHHLSVPLPIIIYDKAKGQWHLFLSSRLAHGQVYKGYKISEDKDYEGKIVDVQSGTDENIYDFSITKTVFAIMFSAVLLIWIFVSVARSYQKRKDEAPKGLQSALEPLILFVRDDVAKSAIGRKHYMRFMPYLLTIFFFIFINNLLGLIPIFPGGANVTGNIGVTFILALATFIITSFNGSKSYWTHMINMPGVPWWLKLPIPLMPIVEIMGMFTKPFVLMVRLFANILAGHIVLLGFISLIFIFGSIFGAAAGYGTSIISVAFGVFLSLLEILVAFIQAYVFTLLSALYFGMALEEHH